jgi:hypothetical protein
VVLGQLPLAQVDSELGGVIDEALEKFLRVVPDVGVMNSYTDADTPVPPRKEPGIARGRVAAADDEDELVLPAVRREQVVFRPHAEAAEPRVETGPPRDRRPIAARVHDDARPHDDTAPFGRRHGAAHDAPVLDQRLVSAVLCQHLRARGARAPGEVPIDAADVDHAESRFGVFEDGLLVGAAEADPRERVVELRRNLEAPQGLGRRRPARVHGLADLRLALQQGD